MSKMLGKRTKPEKGLKVKRQFKRVKSTPTAYPRPRRSAIERKVFDINTATYQVNQTGSFTALCLPVLGTDLNNRVGRKIVLRSLYVRGFARMEEAGGMAGAVTAANQQGRMIIFLDLQPTPATALTTTDLLNEALPSSQLNVNNRDRFKILRDVTWELDPIVTNTTVQTFCAWGKTIENIKLYVPLNEECIFNSTNGGTVADINSGVLYMFFIGSQAAGTNTDLNAVVSTRVRYTDE